MTSTYAQRKRLGDYGERIAAAFLVEQGMQILDRNFRCSQGEIDIVARDGRTVVICEVKTRRGLGYGTPLEAVTVRKGDRLRRLAGAWLAQSGLSPQAVRIDVVGVLLPPRGRAQVERVSGVA